MKINKIKEYTRFMRLKAMGLSTIAIFGALSVNGSIELWHFIVLFLIGIHFNILGFVLNDIVDIKIDKNSKELSERPLVKGTISIKTAKIISLICYAIIFGIAIIFFKNLFSFLVLAFSVALGTIYDVWGKRLLGSDFVLAASIALFCLFGSLTVASNIGEFTIILSALIFTNVLFFNIVEGGFKDVENDRKSGAKTAAVALGVKTKPKISLSISFKIISILIAISTAIFVFLPLVTLSEFYNFKYWYLQYFVLIILIISLFSSILKMFYLKSFDRKKVRDIITKQEIKRYVITDILLISFTNYLLVLVLILIPICWYMFFTFIVLHEPFESSKML